MHLIATSLPRYHKFFCTKLQLIVDSNIMLP
nr:MAG TPA: hypothetical protein [Caudoviricetes sp.]DAH08715.1 MAG TPA: hypothetical protein [Caudoviricetes sp.]